MKVYLISNNSLLNSLEYKNNVDLELVRKIRPLTNKGEVDAKKISELDYLQSVEKIYASFHSSAISTAKYLSNKLEIDITINEMLNDCKVGILGSKNMKMVKGLQDHDFNYKLESGESLKDVGNRINSFINIISLQNENVAVFTHKRAILGFLLKYGKVDYNLDDSLILEYNGNIIYDDSDTSYDIYELTLEENNIISIVRI